MFRPAPISERPPTIEIMRKIGLEPDPWQIEVLTSQHPQLLLNCCRQAGKSTVVALLGLIEAMWRPMTRVVLVSRSHRQSRELLKTMVFYYRLLGERLKARVTAQEIELCNLSRIVCVPCREDTIRGYAHVDLLIIDEAARVPDDLYKAVRPMVAVSKGRIICLSTPYGKRGFFWNAWARGGEDWQRIEVSAAQVSRIGADFLERERRGLGEAWFRQEYCCSFEAMEGLVYPDFGRCVVAGKDVAAEVLRRGCGGKFPNLPGSKPTSWETCRHDESGDVGSLVGGIDFGFRNPFAAVWGVLDRDGVLWLTGEHYARQKPISWHAERLPRGVLWHADPSGASDIAELRRSGHSVRKGNNSLRPGIAAVSARLADGTLRVVEGRCPNLLAETGLYRYGDEPGERRTENPLDEHNHALAALRYLISKLDAHRRPKSDQDPKPDETPEERANRLYWKEYWRMVDDDTYWRRIA